jgi:hypothetical protein
VDLHPDFRDLLAEFVRCEVRFAVLGGYAVGHHAKPRATKDLDLLVSSIGDNLDRVSRALHAFGAPQGVVQAVRSLKPTEVAYLGVPPVRVDILVSADGIETEEALAAVGHVLLADMTVPVISLEHLIENKRAAGRPQDLADVALLERVQRRLASKA